MSDEPLKLSEYGQPNSPTQPAKIPGRDGVMMNRWLYGRTLGPKAVPAAVTYNMLKWMALNGDPLQKIVARKALEVGGPIADAGMNAMQISPQYTPEEPWPTPNVYLDRFLHHYYNMPKDKYVIDETTYKPTLEDVAAVTRGAFPKADEKTTPAMDEKLRKAKP